MTVTLCGLCLCRPPPSWAVESGVGASFRSRPFGSQKRLTAIAGSCSLQTSELAAGQGDSPSDPGLGEEGRDQEGGPSGSAGGAPRRVGVLGGAATGQRYTEERGNRPQPQRPVDTEPPRAFPAKGEEVRWFRPQGSP